MHVRTILNRFVCPDKFVKSRLDRGKNGNTSGFALTSSSIIIVVVAIVEARGIRRWVVRVRNRVRRRIRERPGIGVGNLGACSGPDWKAVVPTSALVIESGFSVVIKSRLPIISVDGGASITASPRGSIVVATEANITASRASDPGSVDFNNSAFGELDSDIVRIDAGGPGRPRGCGMLPVALITAFTAASRASTAIVLDALQSLGSQRGTGPTIDIVLIA